MRLFKLLLSLVFLFIGGEVFSQLQATFSNTVNTICNGNDCEYDGPTILINEIQIAPINGDGSLSGEGPTGGKGEWIELYNPHLCESVDISCYYLGNAAPEVALFSTEIIGGGFQIPNGTIVPPAGFCVIRGVNAPEIPSNLLVQNGGKTVEVIVPAVVSGDGVCMGSVGGLFGSTTGTRLWFPNAGGWFAFYDANGVPQDAISWGNQEGIGTEPCVPTHSTCNTGVTSLVNYNNIPNDRKQNIYVTNSDIPKNDNTIRRMPDGGAWVTEQKTTAGTIGDCNDPTDCQEQGSSSCDGTATVNVTGGSGNYSYVWSDSQAQMTQTAIGLCEGTYQVTVTDNNTGTTQTFSVEIENLELTYTAQTSNPACGQSNGSIAITPENGQTPYTYSINNGTSQSNGNFNNLGAGTYSITVLDNNNCVGTGTEILADEGDFEIEDINITNPSCGGECDGEIEVVVSQGANVTTVIKNESGQVVGNTDVCAGTYTVEVTDELGCSAIQTVTLISGAIEDASFEFEDFCQGGNNQPSNIQPSGGSFSFNPAVTDGATINPTTGVISNGIGGTTYTVEYSLEGECSSTATQQVTVKPLPTPLFEADELSGCSPLTVNFINTSSFTGSEYECLWSFGDGSTSNNCNGVQHIYQSEGIYTVSLEITDELGCSGVYIINDYIEVVATPIASFSASPMVLNSYDSEVTFINSSENATDYIWNFGDGSTEEYGVNAIHEFDVTENGTYVVELTATNGGSGCEDSFSAVITVEEDLVFYVPNTFTPDGDSFNEGFQPIFTSGYDPYSYTLEIYNRWGELIFVSHDVDVGWDGTYGVSYPKIAKSGVYVWKIHIGLKKDDEHKEFVGHVNLLK